MTAGPDNKKVIRQVEYYFGDSNLQRDKFLQDEIAKDPEGWVSLETMLKVSLKLSVLKTINTANLIMFWAPGLGEQKDRI